jgi:hypothetical protein
MVLHSLLTHGLYYAPFVIPKKKQFAIMTAKRSSHLAASIL